MYTNDVEMFSIHLGPVAPPDFSWECLPNQQTEHSLYLDLVGAKQKQLQLPQAVNFSNGDSAPTTKTHGELPKVTLPHWSGQDCTL